MKVEINQSNGRVQPERIWFCESSLGSEEINQIIWGFPMFLLLWSGTCCFPYLVYLLFYLWHRIVELLMLTAKSIIKCNLIAPKLIINFDLSYCLWIQSHLLWHKYCTNISSIGIYQNRFHLTTQSKYSVAFLGLAWSLWVANVVY